MRIGTAIFRGVASALSLAAATPALADFGSPCPPGGCIYDPAGGPYGDGSYDFDYTVPPTALTYRWTIAYTSADPAASLFLTSPTQTEVFSTIRTATGFTDTYDFNPPYRFDETVAPGRTTILVRAPLELDDCTTAGPVGQTCATVVHIWGNGTSLIATGNAPITATFSETAVPEPAAWAMMVVGFGLVGGTMRRRSFAPA